MLPSPTLRERKPLYSGYIHKLFPNRSKLKTKLEVHLLWQVNPLILMVSQLVVRLQIRTHSLVSKSRKVAEVFYNSQPRLRTWKTNGNHKFLEILIGPKNMSSNVYNILKFGKLSRKDLLCTE